MAPRRLAQCLLHIPLLASGATVLAAQGKPLANFTGTVISSIDSMQLPYAQVILRSAVSSRYYAAITDSLGAFRIDTIVPGRYSIRVHLIGYPPDTSQFEFEPGASVDTVVILRAHCKYDSALAMSDIRRGRPRILVHGGIAPLAYGPRDRALERKYRFSYKDFGDQIENPFECDEQYNRVVFRFLDSKYGTAWRDSVRTH